MDYGEPTVCKLNKRRVNENSFFIVSIHVIYLVKNVKDCILFYTICGVSLA